jgi:hypothetical protein
MDQAAAEEEGVASPDPGARRLHHRRLVVCHPEEIPQPGQQRLGIFSPARHLVSVEIDLVAVMVISLCVCIQFVWANDLYPRVVLLLNSTSS